MKMKLLAAAAALAICANSAAAQPPKREMRSIWMAAMGIDWPLTRGTTAQDQADAKQELIDYLDAYKQHNFTAVCIHVRSKADALYKSSLEPWSVSVSGKRGVDPGWDPLAFALEECHKRGLECWAWINPFRIDTDGATLNTPQDKEWRDKGWTFMENNWTIFNPANPGAREHCIKVMEEIWTNYAIDGMLFDDYFYPSPGMKAGESAADYADYKAYKTEIENLNKDLPKEEKLPIMSIGDWRRNNVNTFVKELYDIIQAQRPDMRFGIGPAGVGGASASKYGLKPPAIQEKDWMYDKIYCDPLAWLSDGSIDFISPQIYWATTHPTAPFGPLCTWWTDVAKKFGRHNYISMASYKVDTDEFGGNNEKGWSMFSKEIDLARENPAFDAPGQIYYSAKYFDGPLKAGLGKYLEEHSYTAPALTPIVDWKDHINYPAPDKATFADGTLTWEPTKVEGNAIMRYSVYAVPSGIRANQAEAANGDGIDGQYLLGVTYSPSYDIPTVLQDGYWYAVCAYDGYGYESTPAYVNYEGRFSATPAPATPADGALADWDTEFTWTGPANATYKIQIASDESFRNLVVNEGGLTATTLTLDLSSLKEDATYFWRVFATEPDCLPSMSDTFSFKTRIKPQAETVTLLTPADGVEIDVPEMTFSWKPVAAVDTYTLEVRGAATDKLLMSRTVDASVASITVRSASFGLGDFTWRVIADGTRVHASTSASRSFKVINLKVGSSEHDYEIYNDPSSYDAAGDLSFENLWYRSEDSENMTFESNGSLNRTMVATPERVYISGRTGTSAESETYLREYSALTGEHLRDIPLTEEASVGYLPCNGVMKDSENNICVHNMTLNSATQPLVIHEVNTVTGELTEIASLTTPEDVTGRIDHAAILGDIHSDMFCVFAALSGKPALVRWIVRTDTPVTCTVADMPAFYPADAANFGIAPVVLPVSERTVYVDGGSTAPTFYNFANKKLSASFQTSPDAAPTDASVNGMTRFKLGDTELFAYASTSHKSGVRFTVTSMAKKDNFTGLKRLWDFPANGLGKVDNACCSAPVDAVVDGNNAHVYIYSPGNGLAAYRLTSNIGGTVDILDTAPATWHIDGLSVIFDHPQATLAAYTLTGATVCTLADADAITLPCPGTYIIATPAGNHLINVK